MATTTNRTTTTRLRAPLRAAFATLALAATYGLAPTAHAAINQYCWVAAYKSSCTTPKATVSGRTVTIGLIANTGLSGGTVTYKYEIFNSQGTVVKTASNQNKSQEIKVSRNSTTYMTGKISAFNPGSYSIGVQIYK